MAVKIHAWFAVQVGAQLKAYLEDRAERIYIMRPLTVLATTSNGK